MGSGINGLGYAAGGLSSGLMDGMKMGQMMSDRRGQKIAGGAEKAWANSGGGMPQQSPQPQLGVGAFSQQPQDASQSSKSFDMPSYLRTTARIEDPSGDPNAVSPTGATGKYQFTSGTWADNAPPGASRNDSNAQDAAMAKLTASNTAQLTQALGRPPTAPELYLAHQQGAAGAAKLIQNPNVSAGSLVGAKAIAVNGGDPNAPASAFVGKWTDTYSRKSGQGSVQQASYSPSVDNAQQAPPADNQIASQPVASAQQPAPGQQAMTPELASSRAKAQPGQTFASTMPLQSRVALVKQLPKPAQQQVMSGNLPPEGSGVFDLKTAVKMIQKSYPGASDLDIFNATKNLLPFMNADASQSYKTMQNQIAQQRVDETSTHNQEMEAQKAQTDAWKQQAEAQKEADKVKYEGTKEYRLGQELQVKIQKMQDAEDKAKETMDLNRQKLDEAIQKQKDAMEIARQKVVNATEAGAQKKAKFEYDKQKDAGNKDLKEREFAYKQTEDAFKNTQKARNDAQRDIAALTQSGAGNTPGGQELIKQDTGVAIAPPPAQPQLTPPGGRPVANDQQTPQEILKALRAAGASDDEIRQAFIKDGIDPASVGL